MIEEPEADIEKLKRFHALSFELISLAEKGTLISDYFKDISKTILDFSGADSLNILINDSSGFFRFSFFNDKEWKLRQIDDTEVLSGGIQKHQELEELEELEKLVFSGDLGPYNPGTESGGLVIFNTEQAGLNTDNLSVLILPIRMEGEIIGIVSLEWKNPVELTNQEIYLFQYLFDIIGFARAHRQTKFHLGERIKELTAIYQITRLGAEAGKSLDDVLAGAADIISPGFLHPEHTCCRIVYKTQVFTSKNFIEPVYTLKEDIIAGNESAGYVEVGYTRETDSPGKSPFLNEEQPMLMTIARELGLIAERKHFEDERERLQQQLLHADRLVTVGQLTAGVAHELNEPLGGILGFSQLIKKYGDVSGNVEKDIDKIIKASLHAREIIRKLMLFSRQTPPEKTLFDLNERIDDGLYLLESRLKKSNIVLVKELSKDLPQIKIDPSQLHQVLVNLVVNAIQAMPDGGTLTIRTESSINAISMIIEDTGVGISQEQMDRIFIPFYTTKGINEGTGLGLPVALGIAQSHGGSITVQSETGKGTSFIVKFPSDGETNGR